MERRRILFTSSTEKTTDGLPSSLTNVTVNQGDVVVNYAEDNENIYIKNTNDKIIGIVSSSSSGACTCPYTKEELDAKFKALQDEIDALKQQINGGETTIIVENYAPNGLEFTYDVDVNWLSMSLVADIDLSTCLTTNTDENILSIGKDIELWGNNSSGQGNVIHIYYTASTKTVTVWNFSNYEYNVRTQFIIGSSTSTDDTTAKLYIVLNANGLYINGTRYVTTAQCSNILNMSNITVGSREGNVRSYATYNYIKTMPTSEVSMAEITE